MIIYPLLYDSILYMWLVYYIILLSFCDDMVWVYGIFYHILLCMRYHSNIILYIALVVFIIFITMHQIMLFCFLVFFHFKHDIPYYLI